MQHFTPFYFIKQNACLTPFQIMDVVRDRTENKGKYIHGIIKFICVAQ